MYTTRRSNKRHPTGRSYRINDPNTKLKTFGTFGTGDLIKHIIQMELMQRTEEAEILEGIVEPTNRTYRNVLCNQ